MKKSVLVTSILFSSILLGSNGLISVTNIKANEKTELIDVDTVTNKIKFIDQDGIEVKTNVWHHGDGFGNYVISGKIGDSIDLSGVLPKGYELNNDNPVLKFNNSNKVMIVKINAKKTTNVINFINEDDEKVDSIELSGKVGERKGIPSESVPNGYYILDSFIRRQGVTLPFDEEINVKIVREKVKKNVDIQFIDEKGGIVSSIIDMYPIGEKIDIQWVNLPYGYELANNRVLDIPVNSETTSININVKKYIFKNIVDLKDNDDNIVKTFEIEGRLNESENITGYIPEDYDLVNSDDKFISLREDGSKITVKVKSNSVKNKIEFKDSEGNIVATTEIEGKKGSEKEIYSSIPEDYDLVNSDDKFINLREDGSKVTVKVEKNVIKNKIEFKDSKGNIIGTTEIKDRKGSEESIYNSIPEGYFVNGSSYVELQEDNKIITIIVLKRDVKNIIHLKDAHGNMIKTIEAEGNEGELYDIGYSIPEMYYFGNANDRNISLKNDDKIIEIDILKGVMNRVEFVTVGGEILSDFYNREYFGKIGESKEVENINSGYDIKGDKSIKINSKDGYVHRITLEGKKIDTELIFKKNREVISKQKYSGKYGDKIPSRLIPEGYVLDNDRITEFGPSNTIWMRKIVNTTVNYVDAFGRTVGKQTLTKGAGEYAILSVPRGYLLVNNSNSSINITEEHSVQNILVVPINGIPQPELSNIVSNQINFINRKNNQVIHSYVVQGQHGQSLNLQTPEGYDLAKGITNKLTLDKSKKLINIYMVEKEVTNTTGVSVPHSKTVLTKQTASLYDKNGKKITNRALSHNSGWKSDQKMVLNGVTYYRVATNEYVKADDIVEYEPSVSVVKTTAGSAKFLYDVHGKRSSDRALGSNTAWFTDKSAIINGEKMYRVATNEWVKASDIK